MINTPLAKLTSEATEVTVTVKLPNKTLLTLVCLVALALAFVL